MAIADCRNLTACRMGSFGGHPEEHRLRSGDALDLDATLGASLRAKGSAQSSQSEHKEIRAEVSGAAP